MLGEPTPVEAAVLETFSRKARHLDGHAWLQKYAPAEAWTDPSSRLEASRLLGKLGAFGRSRRLILSTWRRNPASPHARHYLALDYLERHGPLETLQLLEGFARSDSRIATPDAVAERSVAGLSLLRARCLALARDFEAAEPWLTAGLRADPDESWTHIEHAMSLAAADRYDEALVAASRAVELAPEYDRAVAEKSELLVLLGREEDAIAILSQTVTSNQSGSLALQLGALLAERGRSEEALAAWELGARRLVYAETRVADHIRGRQASVLRRLGRNASALKAARGLKGIFWETFATRLEAASTDPAARVELAVPFVRQHHLTCAPATLAAVSAYLRQPIDHLELARAITYDGTPDHEERHWLEAHGWVVREFRVTWEVARNLIDLGLPFTLVMHWTQSAHLQAVIGYDSGIGTLIIRDPYQREAQEALATELLKQQAAFGPRGMVMLPAAEATRLAQVDLPESAEFDEWYSLRRALLRHDRGSAGAACDQLQILAPQGRLTRWAQRQLAYYDDTPIRALAVVELLRKEHPDDIDLQLEELALLARLGRRKQHRELVSALRAAGDKDPAIWREQIELWRNDARQQHRAERLARRYLRSRPYDWQARITLAHVFWGSRRFDEAVTYYRLAATGGRLVEDPWWSYFVAARYAGRGAEALALLEARSQRLGGASSQPAITFARALSQLDRHHEARQSLETAARMRPDDGSLGIELALLLGRIGEAAAAGAQLERVRGQVVPSVWRRTAARLATWQGDHKAALIQHEAVLAEDPLDVPALTEAARLRSIIEGTGRLLVWLADKVVRFPHFLPLRQIRLRWLNDRPPEEALAEVDEFLRLDAENAWALRERALILLRAERISEARESARLAETIEPGAPQSPGILGQVLLADGDHAGARDATSRALRLDITAEWLMNQLLDTCPEFALRVKAVAFLRQELAGQPAPAAGYLRFREVALGVLEPAELGRALNELRLAQSDCWEPWSACVQQEIVLGRIEPALALARESVAKFPLLPRAWLDLADVHRHADQTDEEESALRRASEIAPGWADAVHRLSQLLQRRLQPEAAIEVLRGGLAHNPLDHGLRGRLAGCLWGTGRAGEAMTEIEAVAEANPEWNEPWYRLAEWAREGGEAGRVVAVARRMAERRTGDAVARRRLSQVLSGQENYAGALAEAQLAVQLAPREVDGHDFCAFLLVQLGRRDEALAACAPAQLAGLTPASLMGRAAWVRWQFGERKTAIEAMMAVVAAHPDFAWGWRHLAEWHQVDGGTDKAVAAARRYAELRPNDAMAWGWAASFPLNEHDFTAAEPLLERALRLDPGYDYAAFQLLRIRCERRQWAEAEQCLALIRQHASRWQALRAQMHCHRKRGQKAESLQVLAELTCAPEHARDELQEAAEEIERAGWKRDAVPVLRAALTKPECNALAGAIWMQWRLERNTLVWSLIGPVEKAGVADQVRRAAWRVYLEWLVKVGRVTSLRWHLRRKAKWLAADDVSWGTVSFVLSSRGWNSKLAAWMADWRHRKGVQPWMLSNLVHAYQEVGPRTEIAGVVEAGLGLPADQTRPKFIAWAAWLAAMEGRYDEAARWLEKFDNHRKNAFAALTAAETRMILDVAGAAPEQRGERFKWARRVLAGERREWKQALKVGGVARQNRMALRAAARLAGSRWAWWHGLAAASLPPSLRIAAIVVGGILVVGVVGAAVANGAPAAIGVLALWLLRAFLPDRK